MSDHKWCQDVSRDEAVRAAEDAAAVPSIMHRDLPGQVALLWASLTYLLGRVVRIEGEIYAPKAEEAEEAATAVCAPASPAEGLRTERVTLEVTQRSESYTPLSEFDWDAMLRSASRGRLFEGESVRVVDTTAEAMQQSAAWDGAREAYSEGIARVKAERDAAKEECERLRHLLKTKESECETHHPWVHPSAAPAANAGGDSNPLHATAETLTEREQTGVAAKQEPVGYGVRTEWGQFRAGLYTSPRAPANLERGDEVVPLYAAPVAAKQEPVAWAVLGRGIIRAISVSRSDAEDAQAQFACDTTVVPLYAAPPEARGWLTAEERGRLSAFAEYADDHDRRDVACLLRSLLARSSPPRVNVPHLDDLEADERPVWESACKAWIAAIREAGGEVEE